METSSHGGWEGPRRVSLERSPQGFGFTLRQFIVYPPEAAVAEHNRMEEERLREDPSYVKTELAPMDTIFIKQVKEGSPANKAGLNAGDRIVSVDGENISGQKYESVVESLQSRNRSISLEVVPKSDDILQVAYPSSSSRSPRRNISTVNELLRPELTSPNSAESGFLSDDDILIVGGGKNSDTDSRRASSERTEVHIPVKSDSSPQRFLVSSISSRTDGADKRDASDNSLIVLPKDGTIQIQGLRPPVSTSNRDDLSSHSSQTISSEPVSSRTNRIEMNKEPKPVKQVYPQRTFRLTGVLGSPTKGPQGKPGTGLYKEPSSTSSSPVAKYNPCVNVLPNKPVLVRVDASHTSEERGDTRTPGMPVRLRVTPPQGQQNLPPSHSRGGERVPSSNSNIVNISSSSDGQVRIRVKDPFHHDTTTPVYSNSTNNIDRTSPSMILDASQPTVRLSKTVGESSVPENLSSTSPEVLHQNSNRKLSDPIAMRYCSDKLKPFHNLDLSQLPGPPQKSGETAGKDKSKRDDTDGRLKKFLFQTSATIDVKDQGSSAGEGPEVPDRGSSRGRVRERSLERERKKERSMLERKQRSQSYDRNYHRKNAKNQSIRQHAIYAERSQETQLQRPPRPRARSRKDSDPPSPTSEGRDPLAVSKNYVSRRTSYLKATDSDKDISSRSLPSGSFEDSGGYLTEDLRVPAEGQKPSDLGLEVKLGSGKTPSEGGEVIKEGALSVKMDFKDGKRFADRSWRSVWAKLMNNRLYLYRENRDSAGNTIDVEAHPVDIDEAMVDVAYGYVKKKNVFRLCTVGGTDYLFNVTDMDTMLSWIRCIQASRDSTSENKHVINEDLLLRRAGLHEPRKPPSPRTPSPNESQKRASTKRQDTKDSLHGLKSKSSQRHSKKKKLLPPTQEETINDSQTFGVPLEDCPTSSVHEFVPIFVERCCSIVEKYGLDVVGVYRVPGNSAGISYLKEALKSDIREVDFEDERWRDVNVVSSMLKLFFRKLPDPVIPTSQYSSFIQANRTPNPAERMANLRRQIQYLPENQFATLKFLTRHLKLISSNCAQNKMEVRNLAIVFGPTLIRTADDNMVTMVQDMSDQCKIVESMVDHCDWFFCEDVESQQNIPRDALPGADVMSDTNVLLAKAREESKQYETISPKDIVASVLSAANRKLKRPDRRSFEVPRDGEDAKDSASTTSNSKHSSHSRNSSRTESQSTEADSSSSVTCSDGLTPTLLSVDPKENGVQTDFDSLLCQGDFTFGSVRGRTRGGDNSPNSKRDNASDFPKHRPPKDSNGSQGTVNWVVRAEEPSVLHQDWRKTEYSKKREQIEQEHKLALQDYEKEESTNLEEIIRSKERLKDICATKESAMDPIAVQETASVTSDYSTTSSNNNNCFPENQSRAVEGDRKGSTSLTPDSIASQGSSEDSEFFRSIAAAFEAKYQSFFPKDTASEDSSTLKSEDTEKATSGTEQRPDDLPRSKSFTSSVLLPANKGLKLAGSPDKTTKPKLSERSNSLTVSTGSEPSPRTPQKKTKIEVTLVFEKSEVTPVVTKNTQQKCHSLESSPEKRQNLTPAERRERNRQMRRRRHTLGGPNDARNGQKIVEITLVGEHTTTKNEKTTPVRRVKASRSFGKADSKEHSNRRRNCSSNPNLIEGLLDSGKSLTLPPKKKSDGKDEKECYPQKLNGKQEFFEIQAAL